ncbi:uncharacterized protein GIQ15_01738 [Arthroderma uncinatum]|uniref:uncharacterized protein n=1 Tax=Arthroderma uncinatum TaxID=74035 RepID=UPI00144AA037|nr:uncharacterized protein GIQ15_01738 [Arthroderma uncinatum]KAF3492221.1 hypothetical protein GIQ15_01738 [Arthroderma uncinatum]
MKFSLNVALPLLLLSSSAVSRSILQTTDVATVDEVKHAENAPVFIDGPKHVVDLEKRKGGGGGGRGGGGGSRGGGGRSGGGSGGRAGGGGRPGGSSGGGRGGGTPRPANAGGTSRSGSGTPRNFGGGRVYGGGASVPFRAGSKSPLGRRLPFFLPLAALAFFPGLWLFGVYAYAHSDPYRWHNRTSMMNQSFPVTCLCQEYSVCGCEDNNNNTYIESLLNTSDPNNLTSASPIVRVADVNGTTTIFINGTLENGTTAPDPNAPDLSMAPPRLLRISGYWPMAFMVLSAVLLL